MEKKSTASKSSSNGKAGGAMKQSQPAPKKAAAQDDMLEQFFGDSLKDIFWAEKHLTKVLPRLKKAATSEKLKAAFETHLGETKEHVARLEQIFEMMGKKAQAKKCEAMEGITKESESIIEETEAGTNTRDVGLILAAQKVEHYEIASYGGIAQLARTLGLNDVAEILATTLEEEKKTDALLTEIAENDINYQASVEDEEGGAEEEEGDMPTAVATKKKK